jgi:2,6-dihydroxypyridine 3-monooxygenase
LERSLAPLEGRGAGIVLHPATVRYLSDRQIRDVADFSAAARWVRYLDDAGSVAHEEPCRYRFTAYHALYKELLGCLEPGRYHLGTEVVGFAQESGEVVVELATGETRRCELLVCADGVHSTSRRRLLGDGSAAYAGYVGWRGTVSEAELDPDTFAPFREAIVYCVVPESHILVYPIPSADGSLEPGRRLTNWVWYRNVPAGAPLRDLLTDREGRAHEMSLAAGSVRDRHLAELRWAADHTLPPPTGEVVRRTAAPFVQAVFDIEVERMAVGRACLIGDAAFALRPHVAAGTAKAAEDAWKLGEAIREAGGDVIGALEAWEPGQLELGRRVLARTRDAGRRSQFEGEWQIGDPLPFGLYEVGDSAMP